VLRCAREWLTERQQVRLTPAIEADERHLEVFVALAVRPTVAAGLPPTRPQPWSALATRIITSFPTCPIPEIARLGRTLTCWCAAFLAYFDTAAASNGGTKAVNGLMELGPPHRPRLSQPGANRYRPARHAMVGNDLYRR
jgi:transposase